MTARPASARPLAEPAPAAPAAGLPRLDEIGLQNFAPYLMNRIMGRYNASIRDEMARLGLMMLKMRALATLSVIDGLSIGQLAVYTVTEQSTLSRTVDALEADALVRRAPDPGDSRQHPGFPTPAGRVAFEALWPHMA